MDTLKMKGDKKMKKALSLITVFALLFALVIPMSVSAEDITIGKGTLTVTYSAEKGGNPVGDTNPIRPGDEFTIVVKAQLSEGADAQDFNTVAVDVPYSTEAFEFTNTGDVKAVKGVIKYANEVEPLNVTAAAAVEVCRLTLKVKENAECISYSIGGNSTNDGTSFSTYAGDTAGANNYACVLSNINKTPLEVTVKSHDVRVYYTKEDSSEEIPLSDTGCSLIIAKKITVKFDGSGTITATFKEKDATEDGTTIPADGQVFETAGKYMVTVSTTGWENPKTYEFELMTADLNAQLKADFGKEYKADEEFEVPVTVSELNDNLRLSMVSFKVNYDGNAFEMLAPTGNDNLSKEEGDIIKYGDGSASTPALAKGASIGNLKFKVKNPVNYKSYEFSFDTVQIALDGAAPPLGSETSKYEAAFDQKEYKVTIVPANPEELATVDAIPKEWTKQKDITVTSNAKEGDKVALKYIVTENPLDDTANLSTLSLNEITGGKITVTEAKNVAVIAVIGTDPIAYKVVKKLTPEELYIDNTAPVLAALDGMTGWESSFTISREAILAKASDEGGSGVAKIMYSVNGTDYQELTADVTINEENVNATYYFKAVDGAGNESTPQTMQITVDKDAPKITNINVATEAVNGKKAVEFTVTDTGGSEIESVTVYFTADPDQASLEIGDVEKLIDKTTITLIEGKGSYDAANGTVYIVAVDNAGNKTLVSQSVEINTVAAAAKLSVKTNLKDGDFVEGKFIANDGEFVGVDKNGTPFNHNGWFTKVMVDVEKLDETKFTTELSLTRDNQPVNDFDKANAIETPGEYELTVTTTPIGNPGGAVSAKYKFNIVPASEMITPIGASYYTILDYARMKRIVASGNRDLPTAGDYFYGGMFSGDLDGDLAVKQSDLGILIQVLRSGETTGTYRSIPIMNMDDTPVGE